jgi:RNA polymerase sigma-70 factor, ECF subfamily
MSAAGTLDSQLSKSVRAAKFAFLDAIEPCRPDLWRYCRSLAPTTWDADDLVQETLARAFAKSSELQAPIDDPRRWLLRVATNLWIDRKRREAAVRFEAAPEDDALPAVEAPALAPDEVRDALRTVVRLLPPQERAAVVLKDVFGLELDEVASWLGTTRGAVKAALHRARTKLAARAADAAPVARAAGPDEALLDRFVAAFNARDLDRLAGLLLDDATAEVTGMVQEYGRAQVRDGSLHHTLFDEDGRPAAERAVWEGEPIILLWYTKDGRRAVEDVLRFETRDGGVARLVYAYFQPEVIAEVAATLRHPWRTNGYRYVPR